VVARQGPAGVVEDIRSPDGRVSPRLEIESDRGVSNARPRPERTRPCPPSGADLRGARGAAGGMASLPHRSGGPRRSGSLALAMHLRSPRLDHQVDARARLRRVQVRTRPSSLVRGRAATPAESLLVARRWPIPVVPEPNAAKPKAVSSRLRKRTTASSDQLGPRLRSGASLCQSPIGRPKQ
jgi:hypothetical protein